MKKVVFLIIIISSLFIINNMVRSIYDLWQKQDLLTKAQVNLAREKKNNEQLKKQLKSVTSPSFVEEEARDKLLLAKPGEQIVLLVSPTPLPQVVSAKGPDLPNWQQWLKLFF